MKNINLLTDYKGNFGSKHNAEPYRSGMNKTLIEKYFHLNNYKVEFINFSDIDFRSNNYNNCYMLYTSSEDQNNYYKSYIEDIIFGLELQGANIIPEFKYLRATSNKVFMEILRDQLNLRDVKFLHSFHFGTLEELFEKVDEIVFPIVIKPSSGAMGFNVKYAKNKHELFSKVKKLSSTKNIYTDFWDIGRAFKRKGYVKESRFRKKFIIQNYIPNLKNDWKILIFGEKYYIFYRPVRKNDFRASGSGQNAYSYGSNCKFPMKILDFAQKIYNALKVPHASLDICFDGEKFYLLEFQVVYFGTVGHEKSDIFYNRINKKFQIKQNNISLEQVYVDSIVHFINKLL